MELLLQGDSCAGINFGGFLLDNGKSHILSISLGLLFLQCCNFLKFPEPSIIVFCGGVGDKKGTRQSNKVRLASHQPLVFVERKQWIMGLAFSKVWQETGGLRQSWEKLQTCSIHTRAPWNDLRQNLCFSSIFPGRNRSFKRDRRNRKVGVHNTFV